MATEHCGQGLHRPRDPVQVVGAEALARGRRHDTDHVGGVLFIDRMDTATRKL
jgi:peptide deformylase